jgi:hypothetical protein
MPESNYFLGNREQWLIKKKGRFGASDTWKLFTAGSRPMTQAELDARPLGPKGGLLDKRTTVPTMFGDLALTLIRSKVCEITSNEVDRQINGNGIIKSMEWGVMNEGDGVEEFKRRTGLSVIYHGLSNPVFYPYGDYAGSSPDGDVIEESAGLEMKCPADENVHMKRLCVKTVEEFKKDDFEAYCQCQTGMLHLNRDAWYFASFDPRKKVPELRMKIVKILPDLEWQAEYKVRLEAAIEMMADMLYESDKYLFVE